MRYLLENQIAMVEIESLGAELCSLIKNGIEYVWQAEAEFWPRHAPVLFPIVGRLKDDEYRYGADVFRLGQHGFARDMEFDVVEYADSCLRLSLAANDQTLKAFPFLFVLQIEYMLIDSVVHVTYKVINQDDKRMFFSIGAHPGFRCPLDSAKLFSDYYLEFSEVESVKALLLRDGLIAGDEIDLLAGSRILELSYDLFKRGALILKDLKSTFVALKSRKSGHCVTLGFAGFHYLGLWSKPQAHFLCIEPWYGIADYVDTNQILSDKKGICTLMPGDSFCCSFTIDIK